MAIKKLLKKNPSRQRGLRKNKKYEKENVNIVKKKQNKTLVSQDLKFARSLASNDKKQREKTLKKLRVWISLRSKTSFAFSEMDLMRLWKGLFYCMWMSDKPLIQEDLAESISQLVHCFESKELTILYTKCALKALSTEWFGIDQYRLDKFQMLVRRIIRQTFYVCKKQSWDMDWINDVSKVFEEILLNEKCPLSLSFHITDIYCEELAKVSEGDIPENVVAELLRPFAINLAVKNDNRQIRHTIKQVFRYLMFQSDVGMDYKEKFEAWSKAGFPTGNIDAMEKVELSDDDEDELEEELDDEMMDVDMTSDKKQQSKPLDPRAGRVDVEIPQLPFDANGIVELLSECKMNPSSTPKTRKNISILIDQFKEIAQGSMPLGIKTVDLPTRKNPETNPTKAAKRLLELEDKLFETSCSRRKKARLEIKKKKRVEKKSEAPVETTIETEVDIPHVAPVEEKVVTPVKTKVKTKSPVMKKVKNSIAKTPIKTPAKTLTETPVKTPKTPTMTSVKTPIKTSVKTSTETPVKTPKTPTLTSVKTPIKTPVKTSTETPVKTPKTPTITSVKTPNKTPVKTSTETPVKTPKTSTITSIKTPIKTPAKTLTETPVKTPKTPTITSVKTSTVTPVKTPLKTPTKTPTVKTPCKTPTITSVKVSTATPVKTVTPLKNTLKTPSNSPTKTPIMSAIKLMDSNSSTKKKVRIVLQKNTAQNPSEYHLQLRNSPQNPYDGNKKPLAGVLKPSPFPSPRNPFYKSKMKYC